MLIWEIAKNKKADPSFGSKSFLLNKPEYQSNRFAPIYILDEVPISSLPLFPHRDSQISFKVSHL